MVAVAVIITIIMIIITTLFSQVVVVMVAVMRWYTRIILQCRAVWWVAFSLPVPVCVRRVPKYTAPTPHATRARADSTGRQTRFGTTPSLLSSHHRDTDFTLACSGAARTNFQKKNNKNCWENPKKQQYDIVQYTYNIQTNHEYYFERCTPPDVRLHFDIAT